MHAELSNGKLLNTVFTEDVQQGYHDKKVVVIYLTNGTKIIEKFKTESEAEEEVAKLKEVLKSGGGLIQKETYGDFPETGNAGNIYIARDTGQTYYWDNTTKTYITTGTAGRTGIYTTTQVLPTTFGQSVTINKSDLSELVALTVPFSEGSEVISSNSVHTIITSSTATQVELRVIADNVIESFVQVDTESDLPVTGQANVLYAIKDIKEFRAWDDELSTYYALPEISMDEDLIVECEQGDYKVSDEIKEGTPLLNIIKKMLTKTYYPSFTNPSATLTATGAKLLETGSTLNTTFTVTFNQGTINPAYGTNGKRAGSANGYSLNGSASQSGNTFSQTISESNKGPFTATVTYDAGPQPKDSHGDNYNSPLPAGSVTTNQVKYEFVDALWSNSANINIVAKHSLVSKNSGTYEFNFVPQTATQPEIFDVPNSWNVTKIEMYNPLSGKYESVASEFSITSTTHNNASGTAVSYKRYSDNRGYAASDRKIRITFN